MTPPARTAPTIVTLDEPTRALVRLAALVTAGSETSVRDALAAAHGFIPDMWIEELLLQTYLFAGFPRALNAMRTWRRVAPALASSSGAGIPPEDRLSRGEATCAVVYGGMYERLRENIRGLHPLLDEWMVVEGYGKVLSRPGLDLPRRELCIVAACAAADQERQLHSHLHGALNAGASRDVIDATISEVNTLLTPDRAASVARLWGRVRSA